jgi:dipeptidyl aminopeptidase/acylaminoacyl peptidase
VSDAVIVERHAVALRDGTVALVLHLPPGAGRAPCVVACHGLQSSKDSDKYRTLGEALPRAGLALARFDFRGTGESTGLAEEDTTVGTRVEDAHAVLAHLARHPRLSGRFGLLGSSMGGFVALHVAHERGDGAPVVTWNAPAMLTDLANDDTREGAGLGVPFAIEYMSGRYAIAPPGVTHHLAIHGDADEVVDVEHGVVLHGKAGEPCELVVLAGGDHRLTDPAHRAEAVRVSREWFVRWLAP